VNYQSDSPIERIRSVSFSQDDSKLVTGSSDHTINVWGLNKGSDTYIFKQKLVGHTDQIVEVSVQKLRIVSAGGLDNTTKVWLLDTVLDQFNESQSINVGNPVQAVELSNDESIIISGQNNGTILLWSYNDTNKTYNTFQSLANAHPNGVYVVTMSRDLNRIASTGADNSTALWGRLSNGTYSINQRVQGPGNSLDFSQKNLLGIGLINSAGASSKIYSIVVNCSGVTNSNGVNASTNSCSCITAYTWTNNQCNINCS
jgi:WD40 repeat protein